MAELMIGMRGASVRPKEKLQNSPSTGSDEGQDGGFGDDFDPFHDEPDEPDEVDSSVSAPPEERLGNLITKIALRFFCIK